MAAMDATWLFLVLTQPFLATLWLPTHPIPSHPIEVLVTLVMPVKNYIKWQAVQLRGGRHSGYIVILRYSFEAITVSCKILLSVIIMISILLQFTKESLYALNYTNLVRMAECHIKSIVAQSCVIRPQGRYIACSISTRH